MEEKIIKNKNQNQNESKNVKKEIFKLSNLKYLLFTCVFIFLSYILSFEKYILGIFIIYPIYILSFPRRKNVNRIIDISCSFVIFLITSLIKRILGKNVDIYLSQIIISVIISFYLSLVAIFWDKKDNKNNAEKKGFLTVVYYFIFGCIYIMFLRNGIFNEFKNTKTSFMSLDEYMLGVIPLFKTIFIFLIYFQIRKIIYVILNKEESKSRKIIAIKLIVIILSVFALLLISNKNIEKYIDLTDEQIFELTKEEKQKLKDINAKTYILMDSQNILWEEEIVLSKIASRNKNIKYINSNIKEKSLNYLLLDKNSKEELLKFKKYKEKEYKPKKNKLNADIFVITKTKEGRIVNPANSLKHELVLETKSKYPSQDLTRNIIDLILSGNSKEKKVNKKIGIIEGKIIPKDMTGFIQDIESYGYGFEKIDLKNNVPNNVKMLILLSPKRDLEDKETENLRKYLKNNGKLFLAYQNTNKQNEFKNLNSVLTTFGAEYKDEQVLENNPLNKLVYSNNQKLKEKFNELDKIYKKGGKIKDVQKIQNEIKNLAYIVNNDIIFAKTFENTFKEELTSAMFVPGRIELDEKTINENKINVTTLIQSSEDAFSLDKYNGQLTNVMDLREMASKANKRGNFKLGVNLNKENGGEITIFTSIGPFLDEIKTTDQKYELYMMKDNRKFILNTFLDLMENEDRIKEKRNYKPVKIVNEEEYNKKKYAALVINILIAGFLYIVASKKTY